jgi:2-polyprenyl-3-methyl-5-hydroxy-6-metoxy-1,4-benzoquinol methylase
MHNHDTEPARFLVDNIGLLPAGRVLDVAMGSGRNAVYLAKMGFTVYGVDISAENIENTLALARKAAVSINTEIGDLEGSYHIAENAYDAIICFNYLRRSFFPQIKNSLRPNGVVIYETFTIDQPQFGKPTNPDFLLKYNELLDMFRDFRCLRYREGIMENREAIASIVAQKYQLKKEGPNCEKNGSV